MDTVRRKGLCLNYLSQGHKSSDGPSTRGCFQCKRRHHTLIHGHSDIANTPNNKAESTNSQQTTTQMGGESTITPIISLHTAPMIRSDQTVLLATAIVTLLTPN